MIPPPRIAIVSGGLKFGGSTSFALQLAEGFKAIGVPAKVFSLTFANGLADEFAAAGVSVEVSDENRFIFEDRLTDLYKKIAAFAPTAVIANIGADSYEMLRYMPEGVARVGVVHDLFMEPARLLPTYEEVLDGVAMVNSFMVEDARRAAPNVNVQYLAHGIPFANLPPRSANPAGPLQILFFGRLYPNKGTRLFPQIIDELEKRRIPFRFAIHGNGPEEGYLRETLARHLTSGAVVLSSIAPRDQLYSLIRQNDIFIMASEHEGGPLTLLEAMSLGLVPVCHDTPCVVQEVVNSEIGFRVPQDAAAYAAAIAQLHEDRTLLERMSAAAHKIISSSYSIQAMAGRYLTFIETIAPASSQVVWPASIRSRPILRMPPLFRLLQTDAFRPARRLFKKMKAKSQ